MLSRETWAAAIVLATIAMGCTREPPTHGRAISGDRNGSSEAGPVQSSPNVARTSTSQRLDPMWTYVGDQACQDCHTTIFDDYRAHPMGRSMARPSQANTIEKFDSNHRSSIDVDGVRYSVALREGQLVHTQNWTAVLPLDVTRREYPIEYSIGSGQKGRSYVVNHDGFLFMSPLTWYTTVYANDSPLVDVSNAQGAWGLSPGYEVNNQGFERPILEGCLYCHANRADLVKGTKNRFQLPLPVPESIGCERCHGPGSFHVTQRRSELSREISGGHDVTADIVNPRRLDPARREAVCQQCHLAGVARVLQPGKQFHDFRPGMRLNEVLVTYLLRPSAKASETPHFVGQVEQMYASRCYQGSQGELGCISCHDPHRKPTLAEQKAYYRNRCLQCHAERVCTDPEQARIPMEDRDCIHCHMPSQATDVRHAASTDHRILRNSNTQDHRVLPSLSPDQVRSVRRGKIEMPLWEFPPTEEPVDPIREGRNMALGLLEAQLYHPQQITPFHFQAIHFDLQRWISLRSQDVEARKGDGAIEGILENHKQAFEIWKNLVQQVPDDEHAVVRLAENCMKIGDPNLGITYWKRAVAMNPWRASYLVELATLYAQSSRWFECWELLEQTKQQFSIEPRIQALRVEALVRLNRDTEAEEAMQILLQIAPSTESEPLRKWFDRIRFRNAP